MIGEKGPELFDDLRRRVLMPHRLVMKRFAVQQILLDRDLLYDTQGRLMDGFGQLRRLRRRRRVVVDQD